MPGWPECGLRVFLLGAQPDQRDGLLDLGVDLELFPMGHAWCVSSMIGTPSSPEDGDTVHPSGDAVRLDLQLLDRHGQAQAGEPAEQRAEHHPQLGTGEAGADAEPAAVAESDMRVRLTLRIELL